EQEDCDQNSDSYPVPSKQDKRVGLNVAQQPFDCDKRDNGRGHKTDYYHAPTLRWRSSGMMKLFEYFQPTSGQHGRDTYQKSELRRRDTIESQSQSQQDGCSRPRGARENCGNELPDTDGNNDGPGYFFS